MCKLSTQIYECCVHRVILLPPSGQIIKYCWFECTKQPQSEKEVRHCSCEVFCGFQCVNTMSHEKFKQISLVLLPKFLAFRESSGKALKEHSSFFKYIFFTAHVFFPWPLPSLISFTITFGLIWRNVIFQLGEKTTAGICSFTASSGVILWSVSFIALSEIIWSLFCRN